MTDLVAVIGKRRIGKRRSGDEVLLPALLYRFGHIPVGSSKTVQKYWRRHVAVVGAQQSAAVMHGCWY